MAEPVENFTSSATLLTTDVPGVRLAPDKCTVTILDDDDGKERNVQYHNVRTDKTLVWKLSHGGRNRGGRGGHGPPTFWLVIFSWSPLFL